MKKLLSKWLLGDIVKKQTTNVAFDVVMSKLTEVVEDNSFAVLGIHNLKETYAKKQLKLDDDFEYKIVQICNAQKSHKAINNMSFDMGIMMPKSIIVAKENGKTTLRYMKMKAWMVALMLPDLDIAPMSKMVMSKLEKIITETIKRAEEEL